MPFARMATGLIPTPINNDCPLAPCAPTRTSTINAPSRIDETRNQSINYLQYNSIMNFYFSFSNIFKVALTFIWSDARTWLSCVSRLIREGAIKSTVSSQMRILCTITIPTSVRDCQAKKVRPASFRTIRWKYRMKYFQRRLFFKQVCVTECCSD